MPNSRSRSSCRNRVPLGLECLETRSLLAVITEFMASNQATGFLDQDGDDSDWIEIHNPGPDEMDLSGWHLTDDPEQLNRWTFPAQPVPADGYVVVFASGKDRAAAGSELHTNFKLSRGGEYLALVRPDAVTLASHFGTPEMDYPEQLSDVSYGPTESMPPVEEGVFYMPEPTPGEANKPGVLGFIDDTRFSVDRGFYSAADLLPGGALENGVTLNAVADAEADVRIYFTTDGSEPSPENANATLYTAAIEVSATTTLRAIAVADRYLPSDVDTHTYIFVDDVLQQDGAGLPELTGTDYEMDPDIVNDPRFSSLPEDLKSLPTVSFVGSVDDLFGPRGIIENPTRLGRAWEREVSVELINADGSEGFQENAGLRIQGAGSRARTFSKKGFQLFFRGEYGASQLEFPFFGPERADKIDRIAFRGNFFDSWTFNNPGRVGAACCGYNQALLLRDQFGHETHEDMGALAIAGNWVHLYINGQYWGLYNSIERPDEQFAEHYLGGNAENYDVLKQRPRGQGDGSPPEVVHGNRAAWDELMTLVRGDVQSAEVYGQIRDVLDVEQFADYILLNIFGGNFDWPHNNWYGIRERTDGGKWTFISWDTENFIFDVNANRTTFSTNNSPGIIFSRLRRNADFRLLFADRVHQHMFNGGALTPQKNIERLQAIVDGIAAGMSAESARWGDAHARTPRNTIDTWQPVVDEKINNYFPKRTGIVLDQLLARELYTQEDAPEYFVDGQRQHGGSITPDAVIGLVQLSSAFAGTALVDERVAVTAYIPGVDEFSEPTWTQLNFDPSSHPLWSAAAINGTTGVGFDKGGDYLPWIGTDVSAMEDNSGSVLTRIAFTHDDSVAFERLQLQLRYDDAFVAYLNGLEIARSDNIRTQHPPQAARSRNHSAKEDFEVFDVSRFENQLRDGRNVLAIQVINVSAGSDDLLMVPKLVGGKVDLSSPNDSIWYTTDGTDPRDPATNSPSEAAVQFTANLLLGQGGTIKARVLEDGAWSALSEATFGVDSLGDLNGDGVTDAADIDFLAEAIRNELHEHEMTGDGQVDHTDLTFLVQDVFDTNFGDSNLDGIFDSGDLVQVFQVGEYEDAIAGNSTWVDGDWDGSGDFDTGDMVLAFQAGGFVAAAKPDVSASVAAAMTANSLTHRESSHEATTDESDSNPVKRGGVESRRHLVDLVLSGESTRDWARDAATSRRLDSGESGVTTEAIRIIPTNKLNDLEN